MVLLDLNARPLPLRWFESFIIMVVWFFLCWFIVDVNPSGDQRVNIWARFKYWYETRIALKNKKNTNHAVAKYIQPRSARGKTDYQVPINPSTNLIGDFKAAAVIKFETRHPTQWRVIKDSSKDFSRKFDWLPRLIWEAQSDDSLLFYIDFIEFV